MLKLNADDLLTLWCWRWFSLIAGTLRAQARTHNLTQQSCPGNCTRAKIRIDCDAFSTRQRVKLFVALLRFSDSRILYSLWCALRLCEFTTHATWTRTRTRTRTRTARTQSPAQHSLTALSVHSVSAFYEPPEPCVSYEPRKATDLSVSLLRPLPCCFRFAVQLAALQTRRLGACAPPPCCLWLGTNATRTAGNCERGPQTAVFTLGGQPGC